VGVTEPADFYTGLVADLYAPLRGSKPDPEQSDAFVRRYGEPALELGCGDGDPIIELRRRGRDVDGIDASADMIERCRANAAAAGVTLNVWTQRIETMELPRRYRSIYLAGPTFNLLPDDATALAALRRIAAHLEPGGRVLVPLFVPGPTPPDVLGTFRSDVDAQGRVIRFAALREVRDEGARTQTATLRYEREHDGEVEVLERDWLIHWFPAAVFADLAAQAELALRRAPTDDTATVAVLAHP
jgi:SAM-dependent methyltransferase